MLITSFLGTARTPTPRLFSVNKTLHYLCSGAFVAPEKMGMPLSLAAIAGVAGQLASVAKSLKEIYGVADGDRGVAIAVLNHTDKELDLIKAVFKGGGWAEPADDRIPPGQAGFFSVRDKGFMTGTEGYIRYQIRGTKHFLRIGWNNPFVGTNSASAWTFQYLKTPVDNPFLKALYPEGVPVDSDAYSSEFQSGTGNVSKNKYEVRPFGT